MDDPRVGLVLQDWKQQLEQLKQACPEVDELTAARFLSSTDGDVEQATAKLSKYSDWRKNFVDAISEQDIKAELDKGILYVHGVDKAGHTVVWVDWRKSTGSLLWGWSSADVVQTKVKTAVYLMEKALASRPQWSEKSRMTLVINVTGVRLDQVDLTLVQAYISTFQANYPEFLYKIVVFPSLRLVKMAWETLKGFLDQRPREKVAFLTDANGLLDLIDRKEIPPSITLKSDISGKEDGEQTEELDPAVYVQDS